MLAGIWFSDAALESEVGLARTKIDTCHRVFKADFIFKCRTVVFQTALQQPCRYAIL